MIEVQKLHFTYPGNSEETIRGLDFSIQKGEIFGFLGPSGAGKTTTQNILIHILKRYEGSVRVLGEEVKSQSSDFYEKIGVAFEFPNFYTKFTALENLRFFRSLYSGPTENPETLLEMVGLEKDGKTRVAEFSKGMKMRLNFCRAFLNKPEIVFLDEPLVIFSDTGVLGFFFIGGIILLEKAQNTLESLFVTPLRLGEYFMSKVISLTLIALFMSSVIMVLANGIPLYPVLFVMGVLLSSVFHTLLGFIISARANTLNEYFVSAMLCTFIVGLPVVDFLGVFQSPLFYFFPTKASLLLIHGAFQSVPFPGYIYAVLYLIIWSVLAFIWARRRFTTYVILKTGGRR